MEAVALLEIREDPDDNNPDNRELIREERRAGVRAASVSAQSYYQYLKIASHI